MVVARGGAGPVGARRAGSAAAFGTLFFPPSSQTTLRRAGTERPGTERRGLAWAADLESVGARRGLQIGLGVVWLLDAGACSSSRFMFSRGFVTRRAVAPASMGNPAPAGRHRWPRGSSPTRRRGVERGVRHHSAGGSAAGLLSRRTARAALSGTVGWAIAVWWFGEALGGVLSGTASPLTGAPGAVLLYALVAVLAWPGRAGRPVAAGQPAGPPRRGAGLAPALGQLGLSPAAAREPHPSFPA